MIYYCTPVLNQHHNLLKWCEAAMSGTLKPNKLLIIDNSGRYLAEDVDFGDYPVELILPDENLGCEPAWNEFLIKVYGEGGEDNYCIIANDDVFVHPQTIEHLVTAAKEDPTNVLFHGSGHSGNSFSLFLLTKRGFDTVGEFDRFMWPAYFGDNDYHRRLRLVGLDIIGINDATFDHIGSATVKEFNSTEARVQNGRFERNRLYYTLKWGGVPHHEVFEIPYNGREQDVKAYIKSIYGY
jgi:GT2 family glycosyltransferase